MTATFFVYNLTLLVSILLAWIGENAKSYNKLFIAASFIVIFLLSFLRFDVGHDYYNYVNAFKIASYPYIDILDSEISYKWACRLFSFSKRGYVFVLGLYSFLTLFFLFKLLMRHKILTWGIFIFITFNMLFTSFDQVRQTLAIVIFLYSTKYIETREFKKFALYILLAIFIHLSAIILFPTYFVTRLKPIFWIWVIVILVFIYGYFTGLWSGFRDILFSNVPFYNRYALLKNQMESQKLSSGLGLLYSITVTFIVLWNLKDQKKEYLFFFSGFGLLMFLFSSGNLNLDRVANYFLFSNCISIPLIVKRNKLLKVFFILTATLLFQLYIAKSPRGISPYQTIFSNNYQEEYFNSNNTE